MRSRGRLIEVEAVARRSDGDAINKITLRGTVHSWAERRDAEESAHLALGVRDVVDDLRVQP